MATKDGDTNFNPRSPRGERLAKVVDVKTFVIFQPTLPSRGATVGKKEQGGVAQISTHAPLAGSDRHTRYVSLMFEGISTHAPLAGSDCRSPILRHWPARFQPTLPSRGATIFGLGTEALPDISTHAPLAGSDNGVFYPHACNNEFQPTLPSRGATELVAGQANINQFQPTLPSRGATRLKPRYLLRSMYFNPRSPRGERRRCARSASYRSIFQPTLPSRGATVIESNKFSISTNFNPRSPRGERPFLRQ